MDMEVIFSFVKAINEQNLPLVISMMADDFCFIDTYGGCENRENMKIGWKGYFDWFPDYKISIDKHISNEEFAVILGSASGSYHGKANRQWKFPAAWKVVTSGGKIKVWQVFCDSKKQLDSMSEL